MNQSDFRAALLDPGLPVPEGLTDALGRPAGRRFAVYRNNVASSLTEALRQSFPVLERLLGAEYFSALAGVFLREFPPSSRLMMFYGDAMPDFLARFSPLSHLPYLPDIARLEQALREAYHAADADPVPPERLAALSPEAFMAARLTLAPSLRIVKSRHPIHSIWRANVEKDAAAPVAGPEAVIILRPEFDPAPHLMPPGGAEFVVQIQAGKTVGDALATTGADFDLSTTLTLLMTGGAISEVIEETP